MREPGRAVLASFRPTWRQAVGHGLYLGAAAGAVGLMASFALPSGYRIAIVLVPALVAAAAGVVAGRRGGADVDDAGIRLAQAGFLPWKRVVGVRAERRRRRTVVAVYLESGETRRLPAPYDGALLAHDPLFERRVFMLCHLWETHRDWSVRG
ncbi:hypothetical protein [Micromonospora sp. CPCC 206061]|uniref:hypothetical protein n=1 Tax=Micromonospora sp. CPCC 206061 TaxID=3122410 RepID=UPI002FF1A658